MKLREIKQHNTFSIIIIITLIFCDLISYYFSYSLVLAINNLDSIVKNPYSIITVILFLFYFFDRYNPISMQSRAREIKVLFNIISVFTLGHVIFKILLSRISIFYLQNIILLSIIFLLITIFLRLLIRTIQKELLNWNIGLKKTIIIGADDSTLELMREINGINISGYDIIGYFANDKDKEISKICKYLGKLNQIDSFIRSNKITEIIITLKNDNHDLLLNVVSNLKNLDVCIKIIPDVYDVLTGHAKMHSVTGIPLIDINPNILTEFQLISKRLLDLFFSLFGLVVFLPFFIIISILIKIESKGQIIFHQERIGFKGRKFMVHKLRTMRTDSESETGPVWASKNDPRITKLGKILRKLRLDEFPQLYDVLIGNMSIVGPRPEREFFVSKLKAKFPYYTRRLNIRPGITGWAQVMGSYDTDLESVEKKLKLDFYYIENFSIWLDIRIMIITFWTIMKGKGQ